MMFGLSTVNDYSPMWLKRYQAATGFAPNGTAPFDTVADARLMSLIGMRYLLTGSAATREQTADGRSPARRRRRRSSRSRPDRRTGNWWTPRRLPAAAFVLQARPGAAVSLVQLPLRLKPDAVYVVTFQARAPARRRRGPHRGPVRRPGLRLRGAGPHRDPHRRRGSPPTRWSSGPDRRRRSAPGCASYTLSAGARRAARRAGGRWPRSRPRPYLEEVFTTPDGIAIFRNPGALPRFRFARELLPAARCRRGAGAGARPVVRPAHPGRGGRPPGAATRGARRDRLQELQDSRLRFRLRTAGEGFFVVADSWYPGWKAYLDGTEARVYAVDGFLRGVLDSRRRGAPTGHGLPAGEPVLRRRRDPAGLLLVAIAIRGKRYAPASSSPGSKR